MEGKEGLPLSPSKEEKEGPDEEEEVIGGHGLMDVGGLRRSRTRRITFGVLKTLKTNFN